MTTIDRNQAEAYRRYFTRYAVGYNRYADGGGNPPKHDRNYNTVLTPEQEVQFQQWLKTMPVNLKSDYDYDLRGAWLAGVNPDEYLHMPDTYKKPWHPTFSDESIYSSPQMQGGHWNGENFTTSPYNKYMQGFKYGNWGANSFGGGGDIHIKKENRGKFSEAAKRAGYSTQAYARHIMANKENYSPTLRKRANFALNASKWHGYGGYVFADGGPIKRLISYLRNRKQDNEVGQRTLPTYNYVNYNTKLMPANMAQAVKYQTNRLHYAENQANNGYNPNTQRYTAYNSVEGGEQTVGDGLKLYPNEPWTKVYNRQGYLTKQQHDDFVRERIIKDYKATKAFYDKINNEQGAFDKLSPEWQGYVIDYNYNPGIRQFPQLMRAVYSGDLDAIKQQSSRMTEGKPLGRNKIMENDADKIHKGEYTGDYE